MSCPSCFTGTIHEGTPKGNTVTLYDRRIYASVPPSDDSKGIVVIISDAFGWEFVNVRVLADEMARKGDFQVYIPDFLEGN